MKKLVICVFLIVSLISLVLAIENPYQFTGKPLDQESGLYYYGARYYNPDIGRFTTPDALTGSLRNPLSLNRYSYVQNNPLKFVDPTGSALWPFKRVVTDSLMVGEKPNREVRLNVEYRFFGSETIKLSIQTSYDPDQGAKEAVVDVKGKLESFPDKKKEIEKKIYSGVRHGDGGIEAADSTGVDASVLLGEVREIFTVPGENMRVLISTTRIFKLHTGENLLKVKNLVREYQELINQQTTLLDSLLTLNEMLKSEAQKEEEKRQKESQQDTTIYHTQDTGD